MDFFCTPGQTIPNAAACPAWAVGANQGSGAITLIEITQGAARGTFSLTLVPTLGTLGPSRTVTNGVFSVTF
jgi:hypothetical protein